MVKKAFTLIEAIFAIVILSFVLIGGFQIIEKLYVRNYLLKQTSKFEFVSQETLDQISSFLYYRIPLSVIGYDPASGNFKYIGDIQNDENYSVLEWIGYLNDAVKEENLSGFVDLYASKKPVLKAVDFNPSYINDVLKNKWGGDQNITDSTAVIFAGTFDRGSESVLNDYNNSFGWHGHRADYVYRIQSYETVSNDTNLTLQNPGNIRIYEKFYLADSAYALAMGRDINTSSECISALKINGNDVNATLFLFYNYRPWLGETFCADTNGTPAGGVTPLAFNVNSFKVRKINSHLELKLELLKTKSDINISVSKQKVAF
ncbi:prepilin-type N-terminal cleavage/methylation domain-containing protein [Nautilia sp.]